LILVRETGLKSSVASFWNKHTKSSAITEIARVGGRYAVQGHLRSLALVPIESRMRLAIRVSE